MKKFISILVGVVLTLGAVALTSSCQKDINNAQSLVNTSWMAREGTTVYTLTFKSTSDFEMDVLSASKHNSYKGTFIITGNKPSLTDSNIVLGFDSTWTEDWSSGYFKSDSQLVLSSVVFTKVFAK